MPVRFAWLVLAVAAFALAIAAVGCGSDSVGTTRGALNNADVSDAASAASCAHPAPPSPSDWCWSNPLPQGAAFNAVWGSSATDVWAVGAQFFHWDGAAWSVARLRAATSRSTSGEARRTTSG